jgi:hypothetical protein
VKIGKHDWIIDSAVSFEGKGPIGYYRLTIISDKQFNISYSNDEGVISKGVNTIIVYAKPNFVFEFSPIDSNVFRVTIRYVLEYLGS